MYEIEGCLGQRISNDVVMGYFEVRSAKSLEKACVNVGDNYAAAGANPFAQPRGDGSATASHFQAVPAISNCSVVAFGAIAALCCQFDEVG